MKTFKEFIAEKDHGPFGRGTSSNPHFPTMSDSSLKGWINRRLKNAGAHSLSSERSRHLEKAQAEHAKRQSVNEAHSYGMEPPVGDYIKGLNAADERAAKDAKELKKRYKDMKGGFGKEEHKHGSTVEHGHGEYEGFKTQRYTTGGHKDNVTLVGQGSNEYSKIARTPKGFRVNHLIRGASSFSEMGTYHTTRKAALHHAIAHHKEQKFQNDY